jgi:hypothetical protein
MANVNPEENSFSNYNYAVAGNYKNWSKCSVNRRNFRFLYNYKLTLFIVMIFNIFMFIIYILIVII